jgi:hypothetical protein
MPGGKSNAAASVTGNDILRVTPRPTRTNIKSDANAARTQRVNSPMLASDTLVHSPRIRDATRRTRIRDEHQRKN